MATLKLPYLVPGKWWPETEWAVWENVPYPIHPVNPTWLPGLRCLGLPEDFLAAKKAAGELPPHYDISGDLLFQVTHDGKHPLWSVGSTLVHWSEMVLTLKEGEDNPVLAHNHLRAPENVSVMVKCLNGVTYELARGDYSDNAATCGERLFDRINRDGHRYTVWLDKTSTATFFPRGAKRAFDKRLHLPDPVKLVELKRQDAEAAKPTKGRMWALARSTAFPMPKENFWGHWFMLGFAPDLSGYRPYDPVRATPYPHSLSPFIKRTGYVCVHRHHDGWRVIFAIPGKIVDRPVIRYHLHLADVFHLFPVFVPHDETSGGPLALRGLSFELREYIWRIPGMSSALMVALNTVRGRVAGLGDLQTWREKPVARYGHLITTFAAGEGLTVYRDANKRRAEDLFWVDAPRVLGVLGGDLPFNQLKRVDGPTSRATVAPKKPTSRGIDL